MSHYVLCYKIEVSGNAIPLYCPSRSDREMNAKLRSMFRFSGGLRVEGSRVDCNLDVWFDSSDHSSPFNVVSQLLIGKSARGDLVVTTRNPKFKNTTSFEQQFIDTDWNRITVFLKESTSPSSTKQGTQQQVLPESAQQHRPYGQSLSKADNNTSTMGAGFSDQSGSQESVTVAPSPLSTQNAFIGEGAFSYQRPAVQKILPKKMDQNKEEKMEIEAPKTLQDLGFPKSTGATQEEMDNFMDKKVEEEDADEDCDPSCGVSACTSITDRDREEFSEQTLHGTNSYYTPKKDKKSDQDGPEVKVRKVVINDKGKGRIILKISSSSQSIAPHPPREQKEEEEEEEDSVLGQMMEEDEDDEDISPSCRSPPRGRRRSARIRGKKRGRYNY